MLRSRSRNKKRVKSVKQSRNKQRFRFNPLVDIPYEEKKALIKDYENERKMNLCEYVIQKFLGMEFETKQEADNIKAYIMIYLNSNPNMTFEIVQRYPNVFGQVSDYYLLNSPLEEIFRLFPEMSASIWRSISRNPNITIDFVVKYRERDFDWFYLSENPSISLSDIENNPYLPWEWENISERKDIHISFITNNLRKPLDWTFLSENSAITMDTILGNPELPWEWKYVSSNPNLTIEFIKENPKKKWNWKEMSRNPNLTIEFVIENLDKVWSWRSLTTNSAFTPEQILDFPELPWKLEFLGENKNLTLYFIEEHPEIKFDMRLISKNPNIWFEFIQGNYTREPDFDVVSMALNQGLFDDEIFIKFYSLLQMGEVPEEINDIFPEDILNGIIAEYTTGRRIRTDREVGRSGNTRLIKKSR